MAAALTAIVGASTVGLAATTGSGRTCPDHGDYTSPTGWKAGTQQDLGRDGVEACSDDGGLDGTVRAGAGNGSAYVAVDLEGPADDYLYATTGDDAGVYCGKGRYDEPPGFDAAVDDPQTRDAKRTDACP